MEYFRIIELQTTEEDIQQSLTLANLENIVQAEADI